MRSLLTALLASTLLASAAYAGGQWRSTDQKDRAYPVRSVLKLTRGIMNLGFCWLEPVTNPLKEGWRVENRGGNAVAVGAGMTAGTITGIFYTVARVASGAFDLATFIIPTPPLMDPETPFGFFETLGTDDTEHRLKPVKPPHQVERTPARSLQHGL